MIKIDIEKFKQISKDIFLIDSPSGYTSKAIDYIFNRLQKLGYSIKKSNKGNLEVFIEGKDHSKKVGTSAHVDTLGLMVRSIDPKGNLKLTKIGGPLVNTLDGEYCKIYTRDNKVYRGTIISSSPSIHVFEDASNKKVDINNIEVRLDEEVHSASDVLALNINNGDIVAIDTKYEFLDNGFLKSRFIDDKGSVALLIYLLEYIHENKIKPRFDTYVYFVVYEEVGHGASVISKDISEFVTIDMGCVGLDLKGNEYATSICAKDSAGPYNYELTSLLINIAKEHSIKYEVDIFPFYGSDIGAIYRAGYDVKGALIGMGVSASHGMERTHIKGIENTINLIYYYLF